LLTSRIPRPRKARPLELARAPYSAELSVGWSALALAIPGLGPFIAAGGLTGAQIGMGIPEYEAKDEGKVKEVEVS
jgi:hypothetical protein